MQGQVLAILCLFCIQFGMLKSLELNCKPNLELQKEIEHYKPAVQKIFVQVVNGPASGKVYNYLADIEERFGSRFIGSKRLEKAIDYVKELMSKEKLEHISTESFFVPHWVRGKEAACLLHPRVKKLLILGLGGSVGTPPNGITAEVLVLKDLEELEKKSGEAYGKIVVYNNDLRIFGETGLSNNMKISRESRYKVLRKSEAAGAVAILLRSFTDLSINTPHASTLNYEAKLAGIPVASITVEDANMLWRMSKKNDTNLVIRLKMYAKTLPDIETRNTLAEITGKNSSEIVLTSGHIDSWDVGSGIMDDAAGAFISWYSLALLKQLGLRPRRTLRVVLWSGEELGLLGAKQYYKTHHHELGNLSAVMESDTGTFRPMGLGLTGNNDSACIIAEILKLFAFANASSLKMPAEGSDISVFKGIPQISLSNDNARYFWFHHTSGDSLQVEDSAELDKCLAVWASAAYVIADISVKLPTGDSK